MEQQQHPIDQAALEYLDNVLVLPFSPDARRAAFEFLHRRDHPNAIEERRVGGEVMDYELARRNGVDLLRRADQIARSRGLDEVDEESVQLAILRLCPGFYPFC